MSKNSTLTLLLGIFAMLASPTLLFAQTFTPPVVNNVNGDVRNYLPVDVGIRLDNGDAQVVKGSQDLWRSNLTVRFTQGLVVAEDRLRVHPVNLPGGALTVSGQSIYYKGNYIGEFKNLDADPELVIQFNGFADAGAISATIRSLEYFNANPYSPTIQQRKISLVLDDGFRNKSTPAIITLNITAGNRPPVGVNKFYVVSPQVPYTTTIGSGLISTETDPEGGALSATVTTTTLHGSLTVGASGQFTYTSFAGYSGLDSATYNVCDPSGACIQLKALFSIGAANNPPVAVAEAYVIAKDQVLYVDRSRSVLANDSDPNSGSARVFNIANIAGLPAHGTLKLDFSGSFRYIPDAGFTGEDQFRYNNCDRASLCSQATVKITVLSNTPPISLHDRYHFTSEIQSGNVLINDTDREGDRLTASLVTAPVNGTVVLNADGSFTYTANSGHFGADSLIYQVCDNGLPSLCDTATLLLWRVPNIPPIITVPGTQSIAINTPLTFDENISIADPNAAPADIFKMSMAVAHGTLSLPVKSGLTFTTGTGVSEAAFEFTGTLADINNALEILLYAPNNGFNDIDSLRLVVNDQVVGNPMLDSAKVAIIVGQQEPVVTSVTSQSSDGRYALGDLITIQVTFNKPVNVTGTPQLLLETGATDRYATYLSRNGATLAFRYQVQYGDENLDLDYVSTAALELAGGTISNTSGTYNAILTLPAPGSPTSVAGSKSILVDGKPPTVISIDWPADGLYKAGDALSFTLHFSEDITATSTTLPLKIGATTVQAALKASAARSLTYSYTILNNELDADGIDISTPAGTITDIAGNTLTAITTTQRPGVLVDAVPPAVTAAQVFTIAEGLPAGTVVGAVLATDAGAVQSLQNWQLTTPSTIFQLDAATGTLSLLRPLDHATEPSLDISVTVSDGANTSATEMVRINVTDATPPAITSMDYPADKLYKAGDELVFTAHTSEGIMFTTSTLPLTIGTATVQAALKASTARQLTYAYIIQNGELDADGITAGTPTGTITDSSGNALQAFTPAPLPAVLVDAIPPVVTAAQVFNIPENAATGTALGNVAATDAGVVKPLQNWQGATAPFSLNATTGALTLTGTLNYEANTSFDIPVTVTDGINTSATQTVRINVLDVNEAPAFNTIPNVTPCAGGPESQLTVTGITPGPETAQTVTLSISSDRDIFSTLSIDNTGLIRYALKADAAGTANVTVTAKDNGGTANSGTDTYTSSFTASVGTGPAITITSNKGNKISKGDIAILTATGASTYEWDSGERTESISVRPFQKTTYHVTGTAANGCISEGSFELDINEDFKLDATNIVTPNGDGINDRWVIRNIDAYPNNEVKIFDRSGRLIYEKKGYINDWGGIANGKPLQDGTYYYILDFGPGLPKFKGYITVIRDIK